MRRVSALSSLFLPLKKLMPESVKSKVQPPVHNKQDEIIDDQNIVSNQLTQANQKVKPKYLPIDEQLRSLMEDSLNLIASRNNKTKLDALKVRFKQVLTDHTLSIEERQAKILFDLFQVGMYLRNNGAKVEGRHLVNQCRHLFTKFAVSKNNRNNESNSKEKGSELTKKNSNNKVITEPEIITEPVVTNNNSRKPRNESLAAFKLRCSADKVIQELSSLQATAHALPLPVVNKAVTEKLAAADITFNFNKHRREHTIQVQTQQHTFPSKVMEKPTPALEGEKAAVRPL
jgi:hypothetical protein